MGGVRGRAIRAGLVAGLSVAVLLGVAAPGSASTVLTSGTTECADGNHLIHWSIGNPSIEPMTIEYALAASDTVVYSVDGFDQLVAPGASTSATTVVPPDVTGTIQLGVQADWPNGVSRFDGTSVVLASTCAGSPTTTTVPDTTTTQPDTATTQPETATTQPAIPTTVPETPTTSAETPTTEATTTTPTDAAGGTTTVPATTQHATTTLAGQGGPPPSGPTTTTKPGPPTLPRTGTASTFLLIFGAVFVAAGGSILMHKRNSWAALRGHETTADVRKRNEKKKRALTVYLPPRR